MSEHPESSLDDLYKMTPLVNPTCGQMKAMPVGTEVVVMMLSPYGLAFNGYVVTQELLDHWRDDHADEENDQPAGYVIALYVLPDNLFTDDMPKGDIPVAIESKDADNDR